MPTTTLATGHLVPVLRTPCTPWSRICWMACRWPVSSRFPRCRSRSRPSRTNTTANTRSASGSPALPPRLRGTPQTIDIKVHRAPQPKPVATWLFSSFRPGAHGRELAVTAQVMAFSGGPPRGRCVLEVYSAGSWLYAKPQAHIDGRGRCRFPLTDRDQRRQRLRVRFVPAVGFKASLGAPTWVGASIRM